MTYRNGLQNGPNCKQSSTLGTLRPGHFLPGHRLLGRLGTARKHAMRRILWLLPADLVVGRDAWYSPVCASEGSGLEGGACRGPRGTERGRRGRGECCLAPIFFPLSLSSFFLPWRLATAVGHVPRAPRGPHPVAQGPSPDNPLAGGERRCSSLSVSAWVVPGGRQNARLFIIRSILEAVLVSCF